MIPRCVNCRARLALPGSSDQRFRERARSVLYDPGERGDGTGGLYILMDYGLAMSTAAGPYCFACAHKRLNELNAKA